VTTHPLTKLIYPQLSKLHRCSRSSPRTTEDKGLTLIECLVAIVMVAIVMGAIAPAMVISVATRVQSQKAEQALELAQSEIDRVRLAVERGEVNAGNVSEILPPSTTTVTNQKELASLPGPTYGDFNSVASTTTVSQTRPVDLDGDGSDDFAIQTFRTRGFVINGVPLAFDMGVRVYTYEAVASGVTGNMDAQDAALGITSGEGQRSRRPLATLYTTVADSENGNSLCNYIQYLSTSASTPLGCN
jgi:prepilin-type N-terminal cleavage/methylation domain-containing protein